MSVCLLIDLYHLLLEASCAVYLLLACVSRHHVKKLSAAYDEVQLMLGLTGVSSLSKPLYVCCSIGKDLLLDHT